MIFVTYDVIYCREPEIIYTIQIIFPHLCTSNNVQPFLYNMTWGVFAEIVKKKLHTIRVKT